jgi:hypothetical protein
MLTQLNQITCPWYSASVATNGSSATSGPKTRNTPAETTTWLKINLKRKKKVESGYERSRLCI